MSCVMIVWCCCYFFNDGFIMFDALNVICLMTCFRLFQIGGTYAKPVLFVPEVAIGAIGRIQVNHLSLLLC